MCHRYCRLHHHCHLCFNHDRRHIATTTAATAASIATNATNKYHTLSTRCTIIVSVSWARYTIGLRGLKTMMATHQHKKVALELGNWAAKFWARDAWLRFWAYLTSASTTQTTWTSASCLDAGRHLKLVQSTYSFITCGRMLGTPYLKSCSTNL